MLSRRLNGTLNADSRRFQAGVNCRGPRKLRSELLPIRQQIPAFLIIGRRLRIFREMSQVLSGGDHLDEALHTNALCSEQVLSTISLGAIMPTMWQSVLDSDNVSARLTLPAQRAGKACKSTASSLRTTRRTYSSSCKGSSRKWRHCTFVHSFRLSSSPLRSSRSSRCQGLHHFKQLAAQTAK